MKKRLVDLHVHSNNSDGTWSVEEMVGAAKEKGLSAVALTDHDTVEGIDLATAAGNSVGIDVIPGVELSTEVGEAEVHILGYFVDHMNAEFNGLLNRMRQGRSHRMVEMVNRLNSLGYEITLEEVEAKAESGTIGRPHLARVLVDKGYLSSVEAAFDRLLGRGKPGYVPRTKLTPPQAIAAIKGAHGVAVLAHPGLIEAQLSISDLVDAGLGGIEVYYPAHDCNAVNLWLQVAQHYRLIATGGSDYHGPGAKAHGTLGYPEVRYEVVEQLQAAIHG